MSEQVNNNSEVEQSYDISKIAEEFPEAYQDLVEEKLSATETTLRNYILSLVF